MRLIVADEFQSGPPFDARGLAMRGIHTLDELRVVVEGVICPACGGPKRAHSAFCATDMAALALPQRWPLDRGFSDPHFQDAFRAARRHLELNRTRVRNFASGAGGWRYSSESELVAAGYRWNRFLRCEVPGCGQQIHLYTKPDRSGRVAVNARDYQPHRSTCTDPEYFQRRKAEKAAQTSARRKRRAS